MAAKLKFTKQIYDQFAIEADFSENMNRNGATGETISSQTVIGYDIDSNDVTSSITDGLTNDGAQSVLVTVKNGLVAESPYKVTIRCVTSIGHQWELDVFMKIKEV